MEFLEEAGMTEVIQDADFQHKNGAAFHYNGKNTSFNFCEKFSPGRGTTFQVQRAHFDHLLAQEAEKKAPKFAMVMKLRRSTSVVSVHG